MARWVNGPPPWAIMVIIVGGIWLVVGGAVAVSRQSAGPPSSPGRAGPEAAASAASAPQATETTSLAAVAKPVPISLPRRPDRPLRVAFAGDSLTEGSYASQRSSSFVGLMASRLSADGEVSAQNLGYSGLTATQAITDHVAPRGPVDLIVVEFGTNDVSHSTIGRFTADFPTLLDQLRSGSPNAYILCAGPWEDGHRAAAFERVVRTECEERGGGFASLSDLYADDALHATAGEAYFDGAAADDFHPNDAGHEAIARRLLGAIGM